MNELCIQRIRGRSGAEAPYKLTFNLLTYLLTYLVQFSSVQFIDSMQQLHDRMREQICRQWKRTKRHQSALTIALKLGQEKKQ